ncbi:response regulator [Belnapia moabensis]|uniref:response regulator n=1 Tax=Belnapia moabensis TaxID=365533 RepID=UPI0005B98234|nr:response regulator [Belnapia moabensis]
MILVVEGQMLVAMMIEDTLRAAGYEVALTHSGEEALAWAGATEQLAAVVIEIHPGHGIDGRSVLHELRRANPKLPAVVVTGFGKAAPEADLRGLGGPTARLVKPFGCEDLTAALAGVISSTNGRAPRTEAADRDAQLRPSLAYVLG